MLSWSTTPKKITRISTLPETNIFAPEIGWLEDYFPFGARPIFRGYVSFREGKSHGSSTYSHCGRNNSSNGIWYICDFFLNNFHIPLGVKDALSNNRSGDKVVGGFGPMVWVKGPCFLVCFGHIGSCSQSIAITLWDFKSRDLPEIS